MPWSVEGGNSYFAKFKNLLILCYMSRKSWIGVGSINYWSSGLFREGKVATHKICVEMGFKNILDFRIVSFSSFQIRFCFPQWINDSYFSFTLDIICTLRKTSSINLLNFHNIYFYANIQNVKTENSYLNVKLCFFTKLLH